MKRDIEATLLLTNQAAQKDNGTVPYLTASLGTWLSTSSGGQAKPPLAPPVAGQPSALFATPAASKYTATAAALTEGAVQSVLESIYRQTGTIRSYDLICGTSLKRAFTNLTSSGITTSTENAVAATAVRTFNMPLGEERYKHTVEVFQGDFGTLMLHPDVFLGRGDATPTAGDFDPTPAKGYVIPVEMCELRYTQLPKVQDLPDNGGGPAKLIRAIAGLVVKNPLGFGFFDSSDTVVEGEA